MANRRTRNGAFLLAGALLASGISGCGDGSKSDEPLKPGVVIDLVEESILTAEHGPKLQQRDLNEFQDPAGISFLPTDLGISGSETSDDYKNPYEIHIAIEIKMVNGHFRIKDVSRDGINPRVFEWIKQALEVRLPIFEAAANAGTLEKIVIGLDKADAPIFQAIENPSPQNDIGGAYNPSERTLVMRFGHAVSSLRAGEFDRLAIHEAFHALSEKISKDIAAGKSLTPKVQRFVNSCIAIKQYSYEQFRYDLYSVTRNLDLVASFSESEPEAKIFRELAEVLRGNFDSLQPESEETWVGSQIFEGRFEIQYGDPAKRCADNELDRMYGLFSQRTGQVINYGEGQSLQEAIGERAQDARMRAMQSLDEAYYRSIYRLITEQTLFGDKGAGHPWLNAGEAASSNVASLLYPEEFANGIKYAPTEELDLILEQVDAVAEMMLEEFPDLASLINPCYQELMNALEGRTIDSNASSCRSLDR